MNVSLLAVDIDGTLVSDGDHVPETARRALRRAVDRGLAVALATGRRYRTTQWVIDQLALPLPAICLGGALAKSAAGETLYREAFAKDQLKTLLALARPRAEALLLHRDAHAVGGPDFVADGGVAWNEAMRRYMAANGAVGAASPEPLREDLGDVPMVGCFGEREPLARLQRAVDARGPFSSVLVESKKTPGWYLEILLRHVDKWTALRRFAALVGVSEAEICAVGDARNDLPMIRGAAFGVAMGNADPVVKNAADWVTGDNRGDGLPMLVDRLLKARSETRGESRSAPTSGVAAPATGRG